MKYLKKILSTLPNIMEGHSDDLKIETETLRLWISRDENKTITIEKREYYGHIGFKWIEVETWEN